MTSITAINKKPYNVSFKRKIIDAHTHLGSWENTNYTIDSLDTFVKKPLDNGDIVEKMIVSNADCLNSANILDETTGNKKLLSMLNGNSHYVPLAVCQPNLTNGDATAVEKLINEHPEQFKGLKFHPREMQLPADSSLYDKYMEIAQKYNLPCLFHSDTTYDVKYPDGSTLPRNEFSRPEQIYKLAQRHKNVPVILAHMGGNSGQNTQAAVDLMVDSINNDRATLFADISWVNCDTKEKPDIITAIKKLMTTNKGDKTDRLLFGTDAPLGRFGKNGENGISPQTAYNKTVEDIQNAIKNAFGEKADALIDKIFYKNADDLFLCGKYKNPQKTLSRAKSKILPLGGVLLTAAAITGVFLHNKKSPDKK